MLLSLQYLRGLAATMVVVHHTVTALQRFEEANVETSITTGAAGVDIFFVVSGFIIWVITAQRATDSLTFLKRRIVRIIPMYWLFTFITAAIYLTVLQDAYPDGISAEHVLKSLFFIPYYHPILDDQIFPLLIVGWSLNFEMLFYLIFCLVLLLPERVRLAAVVGCLAAMVLLGAAWDPANPVLRAFTNPLLLEFVAGVAIGALFLAGKLPGPRASAGLIALGLAGLAAVSGWDTDFDNQAWHWGFPAALIVAGAAGLEQQRAGLARNGPLKLVGDASYSIYLSHLLTLGVVRTAWSEAGIGFATGAHDLAFIVVCVAASLAAGVGCYLAVERPLLDRLRDRSPPYRRPAPAAPAAAARRAQGRRRGA